MQVELVLVTVLLNSSIKSKKTKARYALYSVPRPLYSDKTTLLKANFVLFKTEHIFYMIHLKFPDSGYFS